MPYFAPTSSEEALNILAEKRPRVVAGCTDFFPSQQPGEVAESILDLSRVEGLRGITEIGQGWRMGAATSWTDILRHPLPATFDGLKLAAREVGSVQIQNRGTVAGNICNASPAADGVPPLLTLCAEVEIASPESTRTVPLSQFITGVRQIDLAPGELVTALHIPGAPSKAGSGFFKLGSRAHLVISIAMAAAVIDLTEGAITTVRVAVGSCSPVAVRLHALEAFLLGRSTTEVAAIDFAAGHFEPLTTISDVRGSAQYRMDVVPEICRRAILQACEGAA